MAAWFTIAEARAVKPLNDVAKYSDLAITAAQTQAQQAIEDACGIAFTPTSFTDVVMSSGSSDLFVRSRLLTVTSATLGGAAQTLTSLEVGTNGVAYLPLGWPYGRLTVSGTYGYAAPPERVKRAAILLTKHYLVESPISSRAMRHTNSEGETDIFVTEGRGGAVFALPEVNAVVSEYGIRPGLMVA